MKFLCLALFLGMMNGAFGERLADFRWEKRLLVVSGADEGFVDAAGAEKAGMAERNMRVFVLSGEGEDDFPVGDALREEVLKKLSVSRDKVKAGAEGRVWLIGKDGNTVLQWKLSEFQFRKVFAAIDGMPMRQREMREKG